VAGDRRCTDYSAGGGGGGGCTYCGRVYHPVGGFGGFGAPFRYHITPCTGWEDL